MSLKLVSHNKNLIPKNDLKVRINNKIFSFGDVSKEISECMDFLEINDLEEYIAQCIIGYTETVTKWEIGRIKAQREYDKIKPKKIKKHE